MNEIINTSYQKIRRNKEELIKHLNTFNLNIQVSVGLWFFSQRMGRFHDSYDQERTIEERIEIVSRLEKYGVKAVEAKYPDEVNEENYYLYEELEKETGIKLLACLPDLWYPKECQFGSLSNPINKYRDMAIDLFIRSLKFVKNKGLHHCAISPTNDGYTYALGTLYYDMWDKYEDAIAIAMDEVPGVQVALEPKPYEPVPNGIYRTTADALIACRDIESRLRVKENKDLIEKGYTLLGIQPELGHIRMGYEDIPYAISRISREGRLFHVHLNSQPIGNYSQDLNTGVVEWQQTEATLYALKMIGYKGYLGLDLNPEKMTIEKAVEINSLVLNIMNDRINRLKHEEIIEAYFNPEHMGDIEIILAKNMR